MLLVSLVKNDKKLVKIIINSCISGKISGLRILRSVTFAKKNLIVWFPEL